MSLSRPAQIMVLIAVINGLIAQLLESYTAHGLTDVAGDYAATVFHMSAKYQMWHVFALILVALLFDRSPPGLVRVALAVTAALFAVGTLAFSGGMYWVPFGGNVYLAVGGAILLQAGWVVLLLVALAPLLGKRSVETR
jgi:uncharacterized membrane protein YgdD (TMEM256/DUF423 family)